MRISEVARKTGLRASALRYYESIGLLPAPMRINGRRRYGPDVLLLLAGVRVAQQAGFTVEEIKYLFYGFPNDARPSGRWSELARAKLVEVDRLIDRARGMKRLLEEGIRCGCSSLDECELVQSPIEDGSQGPGGGGRGGQRVAGAGAAGRSHRTIVAHSSSIRGVIETALYVDDLARSLEFYRGLLGFTVAMEPIDRMVVLNVTDDQVLVLFKKGASTEATVLPFGTIPPTDGDGCQGRNKIRPDGGGKPDHLAAGSCV